MDIPWQLCQTIGPLLIVLASARGIMAGWGFTVGCLPAGLPPIVVSREWAFVALFNSCMMLQVNNGHSQSPKRRKSQEDKSESHASTSSGPSISQQCLLDELKRRSVEKKSGATFWKKGWRSKLCKCSNCQVYSNAHLVRAYTSTFSQRTTKHWSVTPSIYLVK